MGKARRDRIKNIDIRKSIHVTPLQERIESHRLRYHGHMRRMNEERLPRKMFEIQVDGQRPRRRYIDMIKNDATKRGESYQSIENDEKFNDKMWWRGLVNRPVI